MLIEAGDNANGMSIVYAGYMQQAYQNFDEAPDTSLVLVGWGGEAKVDCGSRRQPHPFLGGGRMDVSARGERGKARALGRVGCVIITFLLTNWLLDGGCQGRFLVSMGRG